MGTGVAVGSGVGVSVGTGVGVAVASGVVSAAVVTSSLVVGTSYPVPVFSLVFLRSQKKAKQKIPIMAADPSFPAAARESAQKEENQNHQSAGTLLPVEEQVSFLPVIRDSRNSLNRLSRDRIPAERCCTPAYSRIGHSGSEVPVRAVPEQTLL